MCINYANCWQLLISCMLLIVYCSSPPLFTLLATNHNFQIAKRKKKKKAKQQQQQKTYFGVGNQVHAALSYRFKKLISHSLCLICEANRKVLPWNKPADLCKRNQNFSQQATAKIRPCELQWEIGQQVPHLRIFLTYFIRKQFSLSNFFFL